ncbi:hypothetical protein [Arthrospira platensis]|uniref:Uncharacterized protein n=1 Tax=Limnospira platensis NIES-46 TaxID=1236695 RepID=A0A5M3T0L5_LIMPL|nr:hypothetical protein [Arthrospira platensis]AMW29683.1 hypothetical protein AP285_18850 [Arthrospira platensis YZ]KDR55779.1 hypothetical protein APPUASWS_020555 [Arthrospira platensis str. Paraca]MBD2670473.1 hypothetical protein [Arthrospira platensis FACHB-439]MBD2711165.1 hypothetical protein [Arthrospira platensis FACHB-835]MDF2212338.1 hypothetical protein [Arthrospira platensis NCB002]MDT9185127.1 hypothetical protein [Limnospira sp. PMC 289.06]MDT9295615.1 hypothetical protein [Ar
MHRIIIDVPDELSGHLTQIGEIQPNYKTQSRDTDINAELHQFKLWRSLPLWKKAAIVSGWTKGVWEMSLMAIQNRYPQASPLEIRHQFALRTLDDETALKVIGQNLNQPVMITDPISQVLVVTAILDQLGIPYLIGGSVASSLLGEPRSTQDIDLVADLTLPKVQPLVAALQPRFDVDEDTVKSAVRYQSSFNIIDNESIVKFDIFILKNNPFSRSEFERRQVQIVRTNPEQTLVLPSPEDIILQKLLWYRDTNFSSEKQWRDILGVMKLQGATLDFEYLQYSGEQLKLAETLDRALGESGLL